MRVLYRGVPSFHQFPPGGYDDILILERFFEFGASHGQHIAAAKGSAVADMGEVGAGLGAVHDHHGDAGLKLFQGVDVFGGSPGL